MATWPLLLCAQDSPPEAVQGSSSSDSVGDSQSHHNCISYTCEKIAVPLASFEKVSNSGECLPLNLEELGHERNMHKSHPCTCSELENNTLCMHRPTYELRWQDDPVTKSLSKSVLTKLMVSAWITKKWDSQANLIVLSANSLLRACAKTVAWCWQVEAMCHTQAWYTAL